MGEGCLRRPETLDTLKLESVHCKLLDGCWESNLGPLKHRVMLALTAEHYLSLLQHGGSEALAELQ